MPPKPKYTKEEVIQVALDMVREQGIASLTARDLGARLGTSARPIFTAFENMEEVKTEVIKAASDYFREYSKNFKQYSPAFKQMGMLIVSFATKEPKLFELLFMEKETSANATLEVIGKECIDVIVAENKISEKQAKALFDQMWIFTFGLSTFSAMKVYECMETKISDMLTKAFIGNLMVAKSSILDIDIDKPKKIEKE